MATTRTLVMTGATRGIGRIAAERILAAYPTVHLVIVARDGSGHHLETELRKRGHVVSLVSADLTSLSGVRAAASEIVAKLESGDLPPLHGFVGNAGIQYSNDLTDGAEGYEATFTVNVLANHLFIRAFQPHFVLGSRIVITVSDTHFGDFRHNMGMVPAPVWQAPETLARTSAFDEPTTTIAGRTAYSTSKLAAIYLVHEFARRLPTGVDIVSFNPGFVPGTGLARNADAISWFVVARIMPLLVLTPMASRPMTAGRDLANAVLGTTKAPTGAYIDRSKVDRSSADSYDEGREADLWNLVDKITSA